MTIYVGIPKCYVCQNDVLDNNINIAVPNIFPLGDERSKYNGSIVHLDCFKKDALFESIFKIIERFNMKFNNRTCVECKKNIEQYNEFFKVHLTLEKKTKLLGFELFDVYHKNCFRNKFSELTEDEINSSG